MPTAGGADETLISEYIRKPEQEDKRLDQNEPVLNHQHTASSGSPPKASGSAGGYLLGNRLTYGHAPGCCSFTTVLTAASPGRKLADGKSNGKPMKFKRMKL